MAVGFLALQQDQPISFFIIMFQLISWRLLLFCCSG